MNVNELSKEQTEALARKLGYNGPMSKFQEYMDSSPRKFASGGLVTKMGGNGVLTAPKIETNNQFGIARLTPQMGVQTGITAPALTPVKVAPQQTAPNQFINPASGQLTQPVNVAPTATGTVQQAATPAAIAANTVETAKSGDNIDGVVEQLKSAQGTVDEASTVQGQLGELMSQFEDGKVPPWAAGAIRQANTVMAQRGISSSSMAGQAVLQAAMESALPIAQQDAQTNFQMQISNLNNEQQKLMMGNEARLQSLFTDTAAENASRQFNASSKNQTEQFVASLRSQTDQFNKSQINAMTQFNAGEKNARSLFVANMENQRQQFNASNRLIIDQANAQWRQSVSTQNNANINEANRINAAAKLELSVSEMNNRFQARRDLLNFAFTAGENDEDRAIQLTLANMSSDEAAKARSSDKSAALWATAGKFASSFLQNKLGF